MANGDLVAASPPYDSLRQAINEINWKCDFTFEHVPTFIALTCQANANLIRSRLIWINEFTAHFSTTTFPMEKKVYHRRYLHFTASKSASLDEIHLSHIFIVLSAFTNPTKKKRKKNFCFVEMCIDHIRSTQRISDRDVFPMEWWIKI